MFDLKDYPVTLTNFNARSELNGENRKPAADISCRAVFPNTILDEFYPGLRAMLYKEPDAPDLVDQTEAPALTSLRITNMVQPLKWTNEMTGRKVIIDYGLGGDSNKVLAECKLHKFATEAQEGGSTAVTWMISGHPDAETAGWLYDNPDFKTKMTIEEPAPDQAQGDLMPAAPKLSKKEKQTAALAEVQAAFIDTSVPAADTAPKVLLDPAKAWPFPTDKSAAAK